MNRDYEILKQDLYELGIRKGDAVVMHSSYRSMGGLEGGIRTFVDAMMSVLGDTGTLIAPTLSFKFVTADNPVFDYINTPSGVGAIGEYIRCMDGVRRSIHPTHSCACYGYKQDWYAQGHENDRTPVGKNSPFHKLYEDGGKVLMLGCSLKPNTSFHGIEEEFGCSFVLTENAAPYTIVLPDKTYEVDMYRHNFSTHGYIQRYDRLENVLDAKYMPRGVVHGANCCLIDAPAMWKAAMDTMKKDELYFVDKRQQV